MTASIGMTIYRLRKAKGYTQRELGRRMGVTAQAVSKWENDVAYPDICLLFPLSRMLDVTVDQLLSPLLEVS